MAMTIEARDKALIRELRLSLYKTAQIAKELSDRGYVMTTSFNPSTGEVDKFEINRLTPVDWKD